MEFGAREIMIALGALVALAIMLDVIRRVRNAHYDKIHVSKRKQPVFDDDDFDEYGSELPSGGARVVSYRDEADVEEVGKTVKQRAEANKPKLSVPIREPEQPSLNLDEPELVEDPVTAETEVIAEVEVMAERGETAELAEAQVVQAPAQEAQPRKQQNTKQQTRQQKNGSNHLPVASVVVLHLMARKGEHFAGDQLLASLLNQGLRYGSMKIFHRHTDEDGAGPVMYSVANSVNPGTFDLSSMDQLTTPGVSFFFAMEDVVDPSGAFESLLGSVKQIAIDLNGELKDETRSALTRQTEDHYRQRIADFCRVQLSGVE